MKKLLAIMLSMLMLVSMVACAASTPTEPAEAPEAPAAPAANAQPADTQKDVNLRMWTFLDPANPTNARAEVLADLIAEFEAANPGVTITVEPQDYTMLSSKFFAAHQTGEAPDIIMIMPVDLGEAMSIGCLEPLENMFMSEWSEDQIADYSNAIFNSTDDAGLHYCFPMFMNLYSIMYRSDLFAEKGIEPNFATWQDLFEAAKALTYVDANGNQIYGLGSAYSLETTEPQNYLSLSLISQDGSMFTEDGRPNNWAGAVGQEALQTQIDMIDEWGITPASAVSISYEELYNNFEAGQYAMIFTSSVRVPTVQGLTTFDPSYVQLMPYPEDDLAVLAGWCLGVWSGSENKDLAGQFVEMCASAEADEQWVTRASQIPMRTSTLQNNAEFFTLPENAWLATAAEIKANTSWVFPTAFTTTGVNEDIQNAMLLAYVDGYGVEDALKQVEEDFVERNTER